MGFWVRRLIKPSRVGEQRPLPSLPHVLVHLTHRPTTSREFGRRAAVWPVPHGERTHRRRPDPARDVLRDRYPGLECVRPDGSQLTLPQRTHETTGLKEQDPTCSLCPLPRGRTTGRLCKAFETVRAWELATARSVPSTTVLHGPRGQETGSVQPKSASVTPNFSATERPDKSG